METSQSTYRPKIAVDAARLIAQIILFALVLIVAQDVFHLRKFLAFMIGFGVFYILSYWTPPRPNVSFGHWLLRVVLITGYTLFGLWIIPGWLTHVMWAPIAYGISAFVLVLSAHWIPPVRPAKRTGFGRTLIFASIISLVFALFGPNYISSR
jgi:hypothetical protein